MLASSIIYEVVTLILIFTSSFSYGLLSDLPRALRSPTLLKAVEIHGSQQTRSPLINWFLIENNIPYTQRPPRPSNHPFGQVPFLKDGDVEVFESGAILLYLADAYSKTPSTPSSRASYTKWVVWANSELDNLCFGGMRATALDKPNVRGLDVLEKILSDKDWLVNNEFSVADVAVGSYLNYVPIFFPGCSPTNRPNIVKYMARCASRKPFAEAFGEEHAETVKEKTAQWLQKPPKRISLF